MKIQLIHEVSYSEANDITELWYSRVNGSMVAESVCFEEAKAHKIYDLLVKNNGLLKREIVVKEVIIQTPETKEL